MAGLVQLQGKPRALHPLCGLAKTSLVGRINRTQKGQGQVDMLRGQTSADTFWNQRSRGPPDCLRGFRFRPQREEQSLGNRFIQGCSTPPGGHGPPPGGAPHRGHPGIAASRHQPLLPGMPRQTTPYRPAYPDCRHRDRQCR